MHPCVRGLCLCDSSEVGVGLLSVVEKHGTSRDILKSGLEAKNNVSGHASAKY